MRARLIKTQHVFIHPQLKKWLKQIRGRKWCICMTGVSACLCSWKRWQCPSFCVPAVSSILSLLFMATTANVNRPSVLNKTHKNTHILVISHHTRPRKQGLLGILGQEIHSRCEKIILLINFTEFTDADFGSCEWGWKSSLEFDERLWQYWKQRREVKCVKGRQGELGRQWRSS